MSEKTKKSEVICTPQQRSFTRLCIICIIIAIVLDVLGWVMPIALWFWWLSGIAWAGAVIFFILSCWFKKLTGIDVIKSAKEAM